MSPAEPPQRSGKAELRIAKIAADVATAAMAFEGRWTRAALARARPDLAERLSRQERLWRDAHECGSEEDVLIQARAAIRGFRVCSAALDEREEPDQGYVIGRDPRTGFTVSIGGKPAAARVADLYPGIPHYTPDEIAMLLAERDLSAVNQVMAAFPGAEIVETRKMGAV